MALPGSLSSDDENADRQLSNMKFYQLSALYHGASQPARYKMMRLYLSAEQDSRPKSAGNFFIFIAEISLYPIAGIP